MNFHQFLAAMDIPVWHCHRTLVGAKQQVHFMTMQLFSTDQNCFGYLLLDTGFGELKTMQRLIENMLFAINLKYSLLTTSVNIFKENKKILIMGQKLAKELFLIPEDDMMELTPTIKVMQHPMEILQQPLNKRQVWQDLQPWRDQ